MLARRFRPTKVEEPLNDNITRQLDYILNAEQGDERHYLEVSMFRDFLGLLDSGASQTIIGGKGWSRLKYFCKLTRKITTCTMANDQQCKSIGVVDLPIVLEGRVRTMQVLVLPSLPHQLTLGANF